MSKMADIQRKVDEAMDSILNINRATPTPFFYTRLEARLKRDDIGAWEKISRFVTRPAFAMITVTLVLVLNIFVAMNETPPVSDQRDLSEVATADDLGTNSFYDIENVQP